MPECSASQEQVFGAPQIGTAWHSSVPPQGLALVEPVGDSAAWGTPASLGGSVTLPCHPHGALCQPQACERGSQCGHPAQVWVVEKMSTRPRIWQLPLSWRRGGLCDVNGCI